MFILKIAWRSLLRHKAKSIIIGTILFLAAFIMTLGNATAIGMRRGVEENMVRSFTGHIILVSSEETKDNVLFTPMAKPLKILKDYDKIKSLLDKQDYIKDFLPMTRGGVAILGGQQMSFMLTFGCNFDDFQRVFGNPVSPVEGKLLHNGGSRPAGQRERAEEPVQVPGLLADPGRVHAEPGQPHRRREEGDGPS